MLLLRNPLESDYLWQIGFCFSLLLGALVLIYSHFEIQDRHKHLTRLLETYQTELKAVRQELAESQLVYQMFKEALEESEEKNQLRVEELNELRLYHFQQMLLHDPKQLRAQFEEKSEALSQTRKEFFHTQQALFSLQKETIESTFDEDQVFFNHIRQLEAECAYLESQVLSLEEITSQLLSKKKASKSKPPKEITLDLLDVLKSRKSPQ